MRTIVAAMSLPAFAVALTGCCSFWCPCPAPQGTYGTSGAQIDEGNWTVARTSDGSTIAFCSVKALGPGVWRELWLVDATVSFPLANPGEYRFTGTGGDPLTKEELCLQFSPLLTLGLDPPKLFRHDVSEAWLQCEGP
jgi:hypothetical protein